MSLINKVLRDLEAQRDAVSERKTRSPLTQDNLRPVRSVKRHLSRQQLLGIGLAVATIAVGVFVWNQWGAKLLMGNKSPVVPKTIAPVPEPAKAVAVPPAPPPAPGITPAPPRPAAPADGVKSAAPAVPASKPAQDIVVRKPKVEPATPEKPAVPVAEPPTKTEVAEAKTKEPVPDETVAENKTETKPTIAPKEEAPEPEKPTGKTVLEKKVKPLSPQDKAESQYRLAATSLQQNRVSEAEGQLRAALAAQPTHVKARELLAGLALQGGRWREAQSLLEQGVAQHPQHYPFAQLLARSYVDHGQDAKALSLLEKARDAAGADAGYFAFLATLYQRNGRHGEAVKSFTEAVKLRPQEGRWWLGLAISLEATEQWKASSDAYQRAIASGSLDKQLLQYSQNRLTAIKNK